MGGGRSGGFKLTVSKKKRSPFSNFSTYIVGLIQEGEVSAIKSFLVHLSSRQLVFPDEELQCRSKRWKIKHCFSLIVSFVRTLFS